MVLSLTRFISLVNRINKNIFKKHIYFRSIFGAPAASAAAGTPSLVI